LENIEERIERVNRSKERIGESIKKEREMRMTKTQNRFHNNLMSFKKKVNTNYETKVKKIEKKLNQLQNMKEEEIEKRKMVDSHNLEKVKQK